MDVLHILKNWANYYETELLDPRSSNLFIVRYPSFSLGSIVLYLLSIKFILPLYMKNRPAYKLNSIIFYYNVIQVVVNAYIFYLAATSGYIRRYSLTKCRDIDQSPTDPDSVKAYNAIYYYMLLKFTEFLDTVFFILRKKDNQVSFLHVYHHATMVLNSWLALKYAPGGLSLIAVLLNSCIHVVMYTYYLLAGLGPKWQKYLWWKRYLTTFQIIQFIVGLYLCIMHIFTLDHCPMFKKRFLLFAYAVTYVASLLYLFSRFYWNTYKGTAKKAQNGEAQKIK